MDCNTVVLIGRLTSDPKIQSVGETQVANYGLAVNRKFKDKSGEMKEKVTFVDVKTWGQASEIVGTYCKKGSILNVVGRLESEEWADKESGEKRSKLVVVTDSISLGPKGSGDNSTREESVPASKPAAKAAWSKPQTAKAVAKPNAPAWAKKSVAAPVAAAQSAPEGEEPPF